jgi:hypothetical protein
MDEEATTATQLNRRPLAFRLAVGAIDGSTAAARFRRMSHETSSYVRADGDELLFDSGTVRVSAASESDAAHLADRLGARMEQGGAWPGIIFVPWHDTIRIDVDGIQIGTLIGFADEADSRRVSRDLRGLTERLDAALRPTWRMRERI